MTSAPLADATGAGFGKGGDDGPGADNGSGPGTAGGGSSRGGVADATATHPAGSGLNMTIPLILLLLAATAWALTRVLRREPDMVPGRREWPPLEPPDRRPE
jgi:hypothetical protein